MLVATEAFQVDVPLTPRPAKPVEIKASKLGNGIRIISKDGGSGSVSLSFAIMCGSSAESLSEQGSSKLLSVAAFGGSADKSGLRICRDLENSGATFRASSDRSKIMYSVNCLADKVDEVFDVVACAISSPIQPNRYYVLEEDAKETAKIVTDARDADATAQLMDLLMEAAYGENTAMGKPEHASSLKNLSAEEVMAFRAANFTTGNLIVSASGLPFDTLKSLIECYFHGMPEGSGKPALGGSSYTGGDMKVRVDLDGETCMALAFPYSNAAATQILVSKLESKVAGLGFKRGSLSTFMANGLFGFVAKGEPAVATKAMEAAAAELKSMSSNARVTDGDKVKVTLSNLLKLEGADAGVALLESAISGVSAETAADVRNVSSADVSAVAKAALGAVPSFAVYGTTAGTPSYATVTKMLK